MRILKVLHANRLAVLLGSGLLCLLGVVAGCDSGSSGPGAPTTDSKAREEAEAKARQAAFGKGGTPPSTPKAAQHKQ